MLVKRTVREKEEIKWKADRGKNTSLSNNLGKCP